MVKSNIDIDKVLFSSEFSSIDEAIIADIISSIPVIGTVRDLFAVSNSDTKRKRIMQGIDLATSGIPVIGQLSFSNILLYLDKTGRINLNSIEDIVNLFQTTKRR